MTHEELVQEVAQKVTTYRTGYQKAVARAILALIAERLKEPTKEMLAAKWPRNTGTLAGDAWRAMLAASPLVPQGGR